MRVLHKSASRNVPNTLFGSRSLLDVLDLHTVEILNTGWAVQVIIYATVSSTMADYRFFEICLPGSS